MKDKTLQPWEKGKSKKAIKISSIFTQDVTAQGKRVLGLEAQALQDLSAHIDHGFVSVVKRILSCKGKLVFCGMGKAGIIAQKVAGTFSSLGHPSFFTHAAEAGHGDLGMIGREDMVFFFSNSGNTLEITSIVPFIKEIGSFTVGITGNRQSYLYKNVDIPLWIGDHEEACGLGLAPTTSTTLMIALGDALAVSVLKQNKHFTEQRFAFNHPGGSLGKKLLRVKSAMRTGGDMVSVGGQTVVKEVIMAMTRARIGSAVVIDNAHRIRGIFSDGDLRRILEKNQERSTVTGASDFLNLCVDEVMTSKPQVLQENSYVMDALEIMSRKKIGEIPVVNKSGKLTGVVCLKDLI